MEKLSLLTHQRSVGGNIKMLRILSLTAFLATWLLSFNSRAQITFTAEVIEESPCNFNDGSITVDASSVNEGSPGNGTVGSECVEGIIQNMGIPASRGVALLLVNPEVKCVHPHVEGEVFSYFIDVFNPDSGQWTEIFSHTTGRDCYYFPARIEFEEQSTVSAIRFRATPDTGCGMHIEGTDFEIETVAFTYAINGSSPQNSNVFRDLTEGTYDISVGLSGESTVSQSIIVPRAPDTSVDAGEDKMILEGESVTLETSVNNLGVVYNGGDAPPTEVCIFDAVGGTTDCLSLSTDACADGYLYQYNQDQQTTTFNSEPDAGVENLSFKVYYTCGDYTQPDGFNQWDLYLNGVMVASTGQTNSQGCTCDATPFGTYPKEFVFDNFELINELWVIGGENTVTVEYSSKYNTGIALAAYQLQVNYGGVQTFNWSPAEGLDATNIQNPVATPTATTTYTVDYTDKFGCQASDEVMVEVTTDGPPTVLTQDITVELNFFGQVTINADAVNNGSFDDVTAPENLSFSLDITQFNCSNLGENTVMLTVTDEIGNSSEATAVVTVLDVSPPLSPVLPDLEVTTHANCAVILPDLTGDFSFSDTCTPAENISITQDPVAGTTLVAGANTITITATDESGNATERTFTYTVIELEQTDFMITNVTESDATISWEAIAEQYNLRYRAGVNATWINLENVTSPVAISDLAIGTLYQVRLASVCDGAQVSEVQQSFTTAGEPFCSQPNMLLTAITESSVIVNWFNEADNYELQYRSGPLASWENLENVTPPYQLTGLISGVKYDLRLIASCEGITAPIERKSFTTPGETACARPEINVTEIGESEATITWTGDYDSNEVWYRAGQNVAWTKIQNLTGNTVTIDGLIEGGYYYLRVYGNCGGITSSAATTNFTTSGNLACQPPGIGLESTTENSATITFSNPGTFDVWYRAGIGTSWTKIDDFVINVPPVPVVLRRTFGGLSSGTQYTFRIYRDCGDNASLPVSITFITDGVVTCESPEIEVNNITDNGASVSITGTADSYLVRHRSGSRSTWISQETTLPVYNLENLVSGTQYNLQVYGICGDVTSLATATSFTTEGPAFCGQPDLLVTAITESSAIMNWAMEADSYEFRYRAGITSDWEIIDDASSPFQLTGLSAGTLYNLRLIAVCGGVTAQTETGSFTTSGIPICDQPDATVSDVTETGATVSWTGSFDSNEVWYRAGVASAWTKLRDLSGNSVNLEALASGTRYNVRVYGTCNGLTSTPYNTSFTTDGPPACVAPAITVENVTNTSVNVLWPAQPGNYQLWYRGGAGAPWNRQTLELGPLPLENYSILLSDLEPGIRYTVRLYKECAGVTSLPVSASFTTAGDAVCVAPPVSSDNITANSANILWPAEPGFYNLWYRANNSGPWTRWNNLEFTPQPLENDQVLLGDLNPATSYTVRLYKICDDVTSRQTTTTFRTLEECVLPGANITNVTESSATINWVSGLSTHDIWYRAGLGATWERLEGLSGDALDLENLASGTEYIVRVYGICNGETLDPVTVAFVTEGDPYCPAPDVEVADITASSATVTWTGDGQSYVIRYRSGLLANWTQVSGVTSPYPLADLELGTTYFVRVFGVCDGITSPPGATQFETLGVATCDQPTSTISGVTESSAIANWTVEPDINYEFRYRAGPTSDWTTITNAVPPISMTGLASGTTYNTQLYAICDDVTSNPATNDFTTLGTVSCDPPVVTISGVTDSQATISWTGNGDAFNVWYRAGVLSPWTQVNNTTSPVLASGLATGTAYQVRVFALCGEVTSGPDTEWFTTDGDPACPSPEITSFELVGGLDLNVTWTGIGDNYAFWLRLDNGGSFGDWFEWNNASSPFWIIGLTPDQNYNTRLYAMCGDINSQPVVTDFYAPALPNARYLPGTQDFTQTLESVENSAAELQLYPIPADQEVIIKLAPHQKQIESASLFDLSGRSLEMDLIQDQGANRIPVDHLSGGNYLLKLVIDGESSLHRFMIVR